MTEAQVIENRSWNNWHLRVASIQANFVFFQITHHTSGCIQSKSGATRQNNRVNLLDEVEGVEQIGFARAGRTATDIHAGDCAIATHDDRAAGERLDVLRVSNFDAMHSRDGLIAFHNFTKATET